MLNKNLFFLLLITLLVQSCGSLLDFSGKGAKTNCLFLDTGKQTIECNCGEKQIASIKIYKNRSSKEHFGIPIYKFDPDTSEFSWKIPLLKDSLDPNFLQIEIHLTDTHWRESYYIYTKPNDFSKPQIIYSRYVSH